MRIITFTKKSPSHAGLFLFYFSSFFGGGTFNKTLLSIIKVSVQMVEILEGLPALEFGQQTTLPFL